jgi:N-methylhydantoinase A
MLATDLRFEVARTHIGDAGGLDGAATKRLFAEMEEVARGRLRASFDGPVRIQRSCDMRYGEQIFEIAVPLDDVDWTVVDPLPQLVARFHDRHEALYTYALRDQEAVLVNARVVAVGVLPDLPQEPSLAAATPQGPSGMRRIYLAGWREVPVYAFERLAPGEAIAGPAIIESAMTTVLLRPGNDATVTPHGWLDIAVPVRG